MAMSVYRRATSQNTKTHEEYVAEDQRDLDALSVEHAYEQRERVKPGEG